MKLEKILEGIAIDFIKVFNDRDFEKVANFFIETAIFETPNISIIYPENKENKIVGKNNIVEYLKKASSINSNYKFHLTEIQFVKENSEMKLFGKILNTNNNFLAIYTTNEYGKFTKVTVSYERI